MEDMPSRGFQIVHFQKMALVNASVLQFSVENVRNGDRQTFLAEEHKRIE